VTRQLTGPGAAVQFDPHADGSRMTRVRHEANPSGDDNRTKFAQLGEVRVAVADQQLQPHHPSSAAALFIHRERSPLSRVVVVVVVVVDIDARVRQWRHLVNGRAAARSGEWAQHISNASCCRSTKTRIKYKQNTSI